MYSPTSILLFADLLHEANRDLSSDFVEFADLSDDIQRDCTATAANLLAVVHPWCPAAGSAPFADAVDWLARHISAAVMRTATQGGAKAEHVAMLAFDRLSDAGQAILRAQATYLLARFGFKDTPSLGARDNGDPARRSPSAA